MKKQKEQERKLAAYQKGLKHIISSRKPDSYDPDCLLLCSQILIPNPDIYTLWNYRKEAVLIEIEERYLTEYTIKVGIDFKNDF